MSLLKFPRFSTESPLSWIRKSLTAEICTNLNPLSPRTKYASCNYKCEKFRRNALLWAAISAVTHFAFLSWTRSQRARRRFLQWKTQQQLRVKNACKVGSYLIKRLLSDWWAPLSCHLCAYSYTIEYVQTTSRGGMRGVLKFVALFFCES